MKSSFKQGIQICLDNVILGAYGVKVIVDWLMLSSMVFWSITEDTLV